MATQMLGKSSRTTFCYRKHSTCQHHHSAQRARWQFFMNIILKEYNWAINILLGIKHQSVGFKRLHRWHGQQLPYVSGHRALLHPPLVSLLRCSPEAPALVPVAHHSHLQDTEPQSSLWGTKLAEGFFSAREGEEDGGHALWHRAGLTVMVVHITDVPGRGELTALTRIRTGRNWGTPHYWKNDIVFLCCHSLYGKQV